MTVKVDEFAGRRRTAWMVVLLAFAIFIFFAVSIPLLISSMVARSMRPMTSVATSNQGSLALVEINGDSSAILETENGMFVNLGDNLITQGADNGTLIITHPDTEELVLRGQIYANSAIELNEAVTPRYGINNVPDRVQIKLSHGRIRLTLPVEKEPITYKVQVPHGILELSGPGQYAIAVSDDETQVSVFEGWVTLASNVGNELEISHGQRAILNGDEQPAGPFATSRNMIRNGAFNQGLDFWIAQEWIIELEDEKKGETKLESFTGENSVRFIQPGAGHAETAIRQTINEDVTDFEQLELVLTLRIHGQTLWVCGTVGSECPLMARLEYEDDLGVVRTWEQGFYADGDVSDSSPDTCQTCVLPSGRHLRVQPGRVIVQEINLLEALQGFPPTQLRSITISSAGHAFDAEVFDIALNGRE